MEENNANPVTPFEDAISGYKSLELVRALQDVQRLQDDNKNLKLELIAIKEDPKLHANLELTKALQEVDRLTSENVNLNSKLDDFAEEIVKLTDAIQKYTDEQK